MTVRVEIRETPGDEEAVLALAEAATEADGVRPLNEQTLLALRYGGPSGARFLLLYDGDDLAGFAYLEPSDPPSGELVVHPDFRGRGLGGRLLAAVLDTGGKGVRVWAHGDLPAAARLAAGFGLTRARALWRMRRPLTTPLPAPEIPEGVRLRTFEPGRDEEAWLALNARVFADHPEQGSWTMEDLKRRQQEPWFDPAGFFLAERAGTLVGFHWTKVHAQADGTGGPIGEVYVVGVDPGERGTGLGRALTLAGLAHLRSRALDQVMLYVDEANTAAVRLYESLGFTKWTVDVMYRR